MRTTELETLDSALLSGQRRVVYALNEDGQYQAAHSAGWEPEEQAGLDEVAWFHHLQTECRVRIQQGLDSPLRYHMYRLRLDESLLAEAVGLWSWRVKRHLQPKGFAKLSPALRARYAQVLGMQAQDLDCYD
jgi:hypothetical protein